MAGRQTRPTSRAPSSARGLALTAILLLPASCYRSFSLGLKITGEITIATPLVSRAPRENSVLFVVAKNMGGVPVAVKRIVNPQFPVRFSLTAEDLIIPGSDPRGPLTVAVEINSHGNAGTPAKGDLAGVYPGTVAVRESRVHIVVDRLVMGPSGVAVQATKRGWRERRTPENVPWTVNYKD